MIDYSAWLSRMHAEVTGPDGGPPVLLVHGWGSSAALMQPIARMLADRYRVHAIDLPGHGQSPLPAEPWGVPDCARLVAAYIDTAIEGPVPLVGHSNGGRIALYMASDPLLAAYIGPLYLISPSGIRARRSAGYYLRSGLARVLKAPTRLLPARLRPYALDWLRHTWLWPLLGSADFRQLDGVMRETFVRTVNCYLEDRLSAVEVPVFVCHGTNDDAISRRQMDVLVAGLKDAAFLSLPGAGHYGYIDQPEPVAASLRAFLEAHPVRRYARASDA